LHPALSIKLLEVGFSEIAPSGSDPIDVISLQNGKRDWKFWHIRLKITFSIGFRPLYDRDRGNDLIFRQTCSDSCSVLA
jgi:hypothetical protein